MLLDVTPQSERIVDDDRTEDKGNREKIRSEASTNACCDSEGGNKCRVSAGNSAGGDQISRRDSAIADRVINELEELTGDLDAHGNDNYLWKPMHVAL